MEVAHFQKTLGERREILTTIQGRRIDLVEPLDEDAYRYRSLAEPPGHGIPVSWYAPINAGMTLPRTRLP